MRTWEPIPKPKRCGRRVSLDDIGGRPDWFGRADWYEHTAYRYNGRVFVRIKNTRKREPTTVTDGVDLPTPIGIPAGGYQWYEVRGKDSDDEAK